MSEIINFGLILQIFVLINPLSSLPVLMAAYKNKLNVRKVALNAISLAFIIAIIIAAVGPYLFNIFNITIDSFRIAGGLVLLLLGLDTIRREEPKKIKGGKVDSLISIIATPLLTGPATISFITIKALEIGRLMTAINIFFAFILVGFVFILFSFIIPKVNMKVVNLMSRVLGLFLAAVAIQMISKGLLNLFFVPKV